MTRPRSAARFTDVPRIAAILCASLMLAAGINAIRPNRIPWVQDWNSHVESKAVAAGIEVLLLNQALAMHQKGECLFVDARDSAAYESGHIPGAISLPFESLDQDFDVFLTLLGSGRPLIVYCSNRDCDDALMLAIELKAMGRSALYYYVDGFALWKETGCPISAQ